MIATVLFKINNEDYVVAAKSVEYLNGESVRARLLDDSIIVVSIGSGQLLVYDPSSAIMNSLLIAVYQEKPDYEAAYREPQLVKNIMKRNR